jgi:plasmid maintenance system antidote protein VapI
MNTTTPAISEKCVQDIIENLTLSGVEMELRMAEKFDTSPEYVAELQEAKRRMTPRLSDLSSVIGSRLLPQGF